MNSVYILAPALTVRTSPSAELFAEACLKQLRDYITVSIVRTASTLLMTNPDRGDAVVIFNRPDGSYETQIDRFLTKSLRAQATILPVAATKEERHPHPLITTKQSFDVVEKLRQRALPNSQVATIAMVFARQLLADLKPTLSVEPMHLFLSHRRFDGEEIAAEFHKGLLCSAQSAFRDLFDVRVGEDAQAIIDERLRQSDAVIFLDTPKAGESPFIAKELETAISFQLPIVWVRVGPPAGRHLLEVTPADLPHFDFPDLDPAKDSVSSGDLESIVHKAFAIHRRDSVDRLLDQLDVLKAVAAEQGFTLREVDPRRMVFSLHLPRQSARYRERPKTHLLQFFGRTPTKQDKDSFPACAKDTGYDPHPQHGPHYDSAILLAPIPSQPEAVFDECGIHTDSVNDYVADLQGATLKQRSGKKRLILSGAFADCEPEFQQNMMQAVHAFTEAALKSGMGLSFGAHPTFQFMIFDLARRLRTSDYLVALHMYVSLYFVTASTVAEFQKSARVFPIQAVTGDRAASLTLMRKAMISDPEAVGLVVIGGKTARAGHTPGIDEEVALAREAGLPVFIVGSVGGRSSELCVSKSIDELDSFNRLLAENKKQLLEGLDYSSIAKTVLDSLE